MGYLSELPLPDEGVECLQEAGITTTATLALAEPSTVADRVAVDVEAAQRFVQSAREYESETTSDMAVPEYDECPPNIPNLSTGLPELDAALDGGLCSGALSVLYGDCDGVLHRVAHHLAVYSQLPESVGGLGGSSVYIDTNQSFNRGLIRDIVMAAGSPRRKALARAHGLGGFPSNEDSVGNLVSAVVDGIRVVDVRDEAMFTDAVNSLNEFVESWGVTLICVDQVSNPFQSRRIASRQMELGRSVHQLRSLARSHGLAAVCTTGEQSDLMGRPEGGVVLKHAPRDLVWFCRSDRGRTTVRVESLHRPSESGEEPEVDVPETAWFGRREGEQSVGGRPDKARRGHS